MREGIEVGVFGSAVFPPRNPERTSLEEAMHTATKNALRDAGIGIAEVMKQIIGSALRPKVRNATR